MYGYTFVKAVNADRLVAEIKGSGLTGFVNLTISNFNLVIYFQNQLTDEEHLTLESVVNAHQSLIPEDIIGQKIDKAVYFGRELMKEYAVKNVKAGKTVAQVRTIIEKCQFLIAALTSGSLYVALEEVESMQPDDVISQQDIDEFSNKIRVFLGL